MIRACTPVACNHYDRPARLPFRWASGNASFVYAKTYRLITTTDTMRAMLRAGYEFAPADTVIFSAYSPDQEHFPVASSGIFVWRFQPFGVGGKSAGAVLWHDGLAASWCLLGSQRVCWTSAVISKLASLCGSSCGPQSLLFIAAFGKAAIPSSFCSSSERIAAHRDPLWRSIFSC